jgi:hypothetical protein
MREELIKRLGEVIAPNASVDLRVVWTVLNQTLRQTHSEKSRDEAIAQLVSAGVLREQGKADSRRYSRGATLESASAMTDTQTLAPSITAQEDIPERALMPFLEKWIEHVHAYRLFPKASQQRKVKVVDTSVGGGRVGLWSRPDFTLAALHTGKFSNARQIELVGYELKKAGAADLTSVHEALAHKRWVQRAFLVLYAPSGFDDATTIGELKTECGRYGLGFVTFSHLTDHSTFVEHLPAAREAIDPQLTEDFIESRMPNEVPELREWVEVG